MPIPAMAIAAGLSLLGQGANAAFTGSTNRASRRWNESMYARQRADALADWNMQNEYNSPENQMKLLKDAGINPRLAYTSGVSGVTSSSVRSTDAGSYNPQAPQFDPGASLNAMYDTKIKQAQIDNLAAQKELLQYQSLWTNYKAAKEGTTLRMSDGSDPGNLFESLQLNHLEAAKANLDKLKAETAVTLHRDEREALTNSQSLTEGLERILTMRQGRALSEAQRKSINEDIDLKKLDNKLRKRWNLSPSDPTWIRLITPFLEKFGVLK